MQHCQDKNMPKIQKECKKINRNHEISRPCKPSSENPPTDLSVAYKTLQLEHKILLAAFESEKLLREKVQEESASLKKELEGSMILCEVCLSNISRKDCVSMGRCGHCACRSCFIQSVAHSAIQVRQQRDYNSLWEGYKCFTCRMVSYCYILCQEGRSLVKSIDDRGEVREAIFSRYQELVQSLQLPPLQGEGDEEEEEGDEQEGDEEGTYYEYEQRY